MLQQLLTTTARNKATCLALTKELRRADRVDTVPGGSRRSSERRLDAQGHYQMENGQTIRGVEVVEPRIRQ